MYQNPTPKPGDRILRPSRAKPWQVSLSATEHEKAHRLSPLVLVWGFAGLIAFGTVILMLPISSRSGQITSLVDALFTATSAVCVTGLVVVDTGTYWSPFGQAVLLVLIQIGGFGFMTSATLLFMAMGRRIGLRERLLIGESLGAGQPGGMVRIVRRAAIIVFLAESLGAIILFIRFLSLGTPVGQALWKAVFHAVSALNNAGIDLFGGFRSLTGFQNDPAILLTVAVLVLLGGIGYIVMDDLLVNKSFYRLSADSKLVIVTAGALLAAGVVFYLLAESSNTATLGPMPWPEKLLVAFFQSVTARSAGFTTIEIGQMIGASTLFTIFLMLVGGASGSTTGGVKVNTFGLLASAALSVIRGKEQPSAFGREFAPGNVFRALALVLIYQSLAAVIFLALSLTEEFKPLETLFETFSALGTVGLSMGITPELSMAGRLIIISAMFTGRLGPLTFISIVIGRQRAAGYRYPKAIIRVG